MTAALYGRLSAEDVAAAEQAIREEPGAWEHYFGTSERATSRDLLLALGVWVDCRAVIERTGLVRAEPPEDVHAMTRGAQNAAGGLYEANMVIDALQSAGGDIGAVAGRARLRLFLRARAAAPGGRLPPGALARL